MESRMPVAVVAAAVPMVLLPLAGVLILLLVEVAEVAEVLLLPQEGEGVRLLLLRSLGHRPHHQEWGPGLPMLAVEWSRRLAPGPGPRGVLPWPGRHPDPVASPLAVVPGPHGRSKGASCRWRWWLPLVPVTRSGRP